MSPGGWVVERMARNGWLEELDHSKLPNWTANAQDYAKGLWFDRTTSTASGGRAASPASPTTRT